MKNLTRVGVAVLMVPLIGCVLAVWAAPSMVQVRGIFWKMPVGQAPAMTLRQMTTTANGKVFDLQNAAGTSVFTVDYEGDTAASSAEAQVRHHSAGTQTVPDGSTTLAIAAGVGCIPVVGTGGATTLGGTPIITAGVVVGQTLLLVGTSDTNTVIVPDSGNVNLSAARTLGNHDTLTLVWDGAAWCERSFSNN